MSDPFFVPTKQAEIVQFVCSGIFFGCLLFGLLTMPITSTYGFVFMGLTVSAAICLFNGLRDRRIRLTKIVDVDRLRGSLKKIQLD